MLKKFLRALFTFMGITLGYFIDNILLQTKYVSTNPFIHDRPLNQILLLLFSVLLFGIIFS